MSHVLLFRSIHKKQLAIAFMQLINRKNIIGMVLILCLVAIGFSLTQSLWQEPAPLLISDHEGVIIESPPSRLPDFELVNQDNQPFTNDALEDKWTLLFFGYMNCPDVCPNTLNVFSRVKQYFSTTPAVANQLQFIFTTVDPNRDTVDKIGEFIRYFDKALIGLTGNQQQLDKFTEALGVVYEYEGDVESGDYIVNHFAAIYIIDPNARLRAYILPPHNQQRVSDILTQIVEYYGV